MKAMHLGLSLLLLLGAAACGDDDDDDEASHGDGDRGDGDHGDGDHGDGDHGDAGHGHGDAGGHGDGEHPDCAAISDACHDFDNHMPNEIHTCHAEIAHANDPTVCAAEKERCIALCEAAAADAGVHDGGSHGHD